MRKMWKKRPNRIFKRFVCSFLIVLVFPIVFLVFFFLQNYRNLYRDMHIEQAENALHMVGKELNRDIENLHAIVNYNSLVQNTTTTALVKDYEGRKMKDNLEAELVTNSFLKQVYYYSQKIPDKIYSNEGTFTLDYYTKLYTGLDNKDLFLQKIQDIRSTTWMRWESEADGGRITVQYMINDNSDGLWLFSISDVALSQILYGEGAVTVLQNLEGDVLFSTEPLEEKEYFKIVFDSSDNGFQLVRYIDEESLFAKVNEWQTSFFVMIIIILLIGGILVLVLTSFNEHPIKEMQSYVMEKVPHIPDTVEGMDIFRVALEKVEERAALSEKKQTKNRLLLRLIYGYDCDTEDFRNGVMEAGLFAQAAIYRVIIAISEEEAIRDKIRLYLEMYKQESDNCEFHMVDNSGKDVTVLIVGMTDEGNRTLKEELLSMANTIREHAEKNVCFYIGGKCNEFKQIHLSYSQALLCSQRNRGNVKNTVHYYETVRRGAKFVYPKKELDLLNESLLEADLEEVRKVTDMLIGILREYNEDRFSSVSLYYDILNAYYRAQTRLELDVDAEFLEADLLEVRDNLSAIQMILRVREQYQEYIEKVRGISTIPEQPEGEEVILKVLAYIEENSRNRDLSVSMVADHFNMSISLMSQKFKKQTQRTISDYITEKKFAYACELLLESEYSIKEISFITGYSHPESFIRKFKHEYKMTPMEYRLEKREK